MNLYRKFDRVRRLHFVITRYEEIERQKEYYAAYGYHGDQDIKVQSSRSFDRMERSIIKLQEFRERKADLLDVYITELQDLPHFLQQTNDFDDYYILDLYISGAELDQIPYKKKEYDSTHDAIRSAIRRIHIDELSAQRAV